MQELRHALTCRAMLCVFTVAADNNLPSTLWPRSLLNEAHDVSLFCESPLCLVFPL